MNQNKDKYFTIGLFSLAGMLLGFIIWYLSLKMPSQKIDGNIVQQANVNSNQDAQGLRTSPLAQLQCNQDIWKFVYHPQRLKVIEPCKRITGTLVNYVMEADGDFHGRIDVQDKTLINNDNVIGQHGYLVIEGICQGKITQADAKDPCQGYTTPKFNLKPLLGKKVEVIGSYIQDKEHNKGSGGWLEIHPVLSIQEIK